MSYPILDRCLKIEFSPFTGYGHRFVTTECPEALFLLCLQSITGVFIQAFMVGIVFAKLSRPKKRAQTLLFSRNAVICHRDGVPCEFLVSKSLTFYV
jgi:potassium inwardly-rectifying channel subfamily J, other